MRKEKTITLNDRGNELTFKIREMPAMKLQGWLFRAALILLRGVSINNNGDLVNDAIKLVGEQGIAAFRNVNYEEAKPLLNELLECCSRLDGNVSVKLTADVVDGMIEDVRTLFALEQEAAAINLSFLKAAEPSSTREGTQKAAAETTSKPRILIRSPHS